MRIEPEWVEVSDQVDEQARSVADRRERPARH
jgi:hypothetical protein